jgi:hypothetical protein
MFGDSTAEARRCVFGLESQDPRLKTQDSRPKTQDPRLKTQDSRPKTQDPRLRTQDYERTSVLASLRLGVEFRMSLRAASGNVASHPVARQAIQSWQPILILGIKFWVSRIATISYSQFFPNNEAISRLSFDKIEHTSQDSRIAPSPYCCRDSTHKQANAHVRN